MNGAYARVRVPGGSRFVHRVLWEAHYGPIARNMQVHHINGCKKDNRIENLELLDVGEHARIHLLAKPLRYLRVIRDYICTECASPFQAKGRAVSCSTRCASRRQRRLLATRGK